MALPDMIRKARTERGLTLQQMGQMIGRSKQYMSQLEKGRIMLSYEAAVRIAEAMETTPDNLFLEKR